VNFVRARAVVRPAMPPPRIIIFIGLELFDGMMVIGYRIFASGKGKI